MQALRWIFNLISVLAAGVVLANGARWLIGESSAPSALRSAIDRPTMLLALQADCVVCKESSPFYRELVARNSREHLYDIVAAFPSKDSQRAERFIELQRLSFDRVVFSDLGAAGILGTPTLLVIDRNGRLAKRFVGGLNAKQQSELLALTTNAKQDGYSPQFGRENDHIAAPTSANVDIVLDVREREHFQSSHWPNSINVPLKEIQVRYLEEIGKYKRIGIAHREVSHACATDVPAGDSQLSSLVLPDAGAVAKKILAELGHTGEILLIDTTPPE
jgi:hypothetical protein